MTTKIEMILLVVIILGMNPVVYGLAHPEPAVYIVNVAHGIPTGIDIEVGEDFLLIWGVGNPGNVPMENITTFGSLAAGVTYVSSNSPDCTYDDSIRKITCVTTEVFQPTSPRTSQIIYNHILTLNEVGFGFWSNAATVCGDFDNTQFCKSDDSFVTAIEPVIIPVPIPIPDPIPVPVPDPVIDPIPLIQPINVDSLNLIITNLQSTITQLELRTIALENAPGLQPHNHTAIEGRLTTLEQTVTDLVQIVTGLVQSVTDQLQSWNEFASNWNRVF